MSYNNVENYDIFEKDHRSVDAYRKQKRNAKFINKEGYITKTIYDPANALSKRYKKKLLAENLDGFTADVPYSMNKHRRWGNVHARSLLKDYQRSLPEAMIVNRTDGPLTDVSNANAVENVQIVENDAITTLSAGGRRKTLKYFNGQIRKLRKMDKEQIEPARIHFTITAEVYPEKRKSKKSKRTKRRKCLFERVSTYDFQISGASLPSGHDENVGYKTREKLKTFGNSVSSIDKDLQTSGCKEAQHQCCGEVTASILEEKAGKTALVMPHDHLDLSATLRTSCIIEIFETKIKQKLIPSILGSSDYSALFLKLQDFIRGTRMEEDVPAQQCRTTLYPEAFDEDVNILSLAQVAKRYDEQAQIVCLSRPYVEDASEISSYELLENSVNTPNYCSCCHLSGKGLLPSNHGMMCHNCITSSILQQLHSNCSSVEIPIFYPPSCSPIEHLHAAVPVSVMSLFIKSFIPAYVRTVNVCFAIFATTHWPMNCEEYRRWTDRWDTHYLLEKNQKFGDGQMRLCFHCETVFQVPKNTINVRCPNWDCKFRYDENGILYHYHYFKRDLSLKSLKLMEALGYKMEYCAECGEQNEPGTIILKGLVNKKTAKLCGEARRQRFEKHIREPFEKYVIKNFSSKEEQKKLNERRRLVLFLVENCTAWLYLNKPDDSHELKKRTSNLLAQLLDIQLRTPEPRDDFLKQMKNLRTSAEELISVFRRKLNK